VRILVDVAHMSPVTAICVRGAPVDRMRSARYCSNACRQRAYARRAAGAGRP
jgi:hypothetical protein